MISFSDRADDDCVDVVTAPNGAGDERKASSARHAPITRIPGKRDGNGKRESDLIELRETTEPFSY